MTCEGQSVHWILPVLIVAGALAAALKAVDGEWVDVLIWVVSIAGLVVATRRFADRVSLVDGSQLSFRTLWGEVLIEPKDVKSIRSVGMGQVAWRCRGRRTMRLYPRSLACIRALAVRVRILQPSVDVRLDDDAA